MVNFLKHGPKVCKRDVCGLSVTKYVVVDELGINIGEFDSKIDAFKLLVENPNSKIFRFVISELLK